MALICKSGRMVAASSTRSGGTRTIGTRTAYTNCKICNKPGQRTPVWAVKAGHAIYDQPAHRMFFTDATVDIFGIPVFYTPFFTHGDPTVRRASGLLMPQIGDSSTLGFYTRLPVYISLNDSQDFTIAPFLTSRMGDEVEGEYRQRWNDGGFWVQTSIADNPHGGILDNQHQIYSSFFSSGLIQLDDTWHAGMDVQLTSNETYLELFKISQAQRLQNDLYVEGISDRSRFEISGYFFQGLLATDNNKQFPVVLPLVEYTYEPLDDVLGGQFRFDFNTAAISRDDGEDDQRATGEMRWQVPYITSNGQLITLTADTRGDVYHVQDPQLGPSPPNTYPLNGTIPHSAFISRGLPFGAVDWRWPFVTSGVGSTSYVFEPIAQFIGAPYGGNPPGIPNEDSSDFQFDETDIFSYNRLPGYDLVETGPRSNVGFRAQAVYPTGSVELLVGQEYRLKPDPIFAADSGIPGSKSDVVSRLSFNFLPHYSLTERVDIDSQTGSLRRNEVYLNAYFGRSSLEVSYLKVPEEEASLGLPTREEVNAQALIGLWKYWLVYAAAQRDLEDDTMIAEEYGVGYDDECIGISLSYRRQYTSDRNVPPSTDVLMRVNLKTSEEPSPTLTLFPQHLYPHTPL
jgi:LPS-assembly protein